MCDSENKVVNYSDAKKLCVAYFFVSSLLGKKKVVCLDFNVKNVEIFFFIVRPNKR